jgi:hypothetical protein
MGDTIANVYFDYQNKHRTVRDKVKVNIGIYNLYDSNKTGDIYLRVEWDTADNLLNSGNEINTGYSVNSYNNIDDLIDDAIRKIGTGTFSFYSNEYSFDKIEKCSSDIERFKEKTNNKYEAFEDYDSNSNTSYEKKSSSYDSKSDISIMYGGVKDSYNENKRLKEKQRKQAKEIFNKGSSTSMIVFKILGLATIGTLKGFFIFIKMVFKIFGSIIFKDLKKLR